MPTYTDKQLEARACSPGDTGSVLLAPGQGVLPKGQILGRVSASPNYFKVYNSAATDGTQTAVCVLAEQKDTTGSDPVSGLVLWTGRVYVSSLVPSTLTSGIKTDLSVKYYNANEIRFRGGY